MQYPEFNHQVNNVTRNFPQLVILLVNGIFTLGGSFFFPVEQLCEWGEAVVILIISNREGK